MDPKRNTLVIVYLCFVVMAMTSAIFFLLDRDKRWIYRTRTSIASVGDSDQKLAVMYDRMGRYERETNTYFFVSIGGSALALLLFAFALGPNYGKPRL